VFTADIGNTNIVGQACYNGVTSYSVKGSGSDIYGNADQFRYVYKTFGGDGTLQAKVTSQDQTNPFNKAGLMFRNALDSAASNIFMSITSSNGITFQNRPTANTATTTLDQAGPIAPYFLRLVKQGQVYTGYASADSISWTQLATITSNVGSAGAISGGLAVTSHDNTQLSTVQFDQVGFYLYSTNDINIALNKPSYGSDYDDVSRTGNFANDGDNATRWASLANADPQWYEVDLGQAFKLKRVNINWDAKYAQDFQLQVSDDAVTWTTAQQITANTILKNSLLLSASARFVRINATKSAGNNGYAINEFQVFGDTLTNTLVDIAKGKTVVSSADASATLAAAKVVDADFTTRWASAQTDPQWIYVDLGKTYNVTNVNITWQLNLAKDFEVQVSADAANWTTLKSITNNTAYANFIPVSGTGRYIRIYGTAKAGASYSIYDLQVLGTAAGSTGSTTIKYNIDQFVVYPNPTTGKFSVDFESLVAQDIELQITDIHGTIIQKQKLNKQLGSYHYAADFSHVAGGEYVVSLKTAKGIVSRKVVRL
jgi:hypothetical protein